MAVECIKNREHKATLDGRSPDLCPSYVARRLAQSPLKRSNAVSTLSARPIAELRRAL